MRAFQRTNVFINETYEYAFSAVPQARKKSTVSLLLVMMGISFSSSGLTLGAEFGNTMTFAKALAACLIGNTFLFIFSLFWGMLGYKSGYTSVFLVKKILGDKAGNVFSLLVVAAMITWVGVNGDLLAKMIVCIFPEWPFPIPVTVLLAVTVCVCCVVGGWKNLEIVAKLSIPVIIGLTMHNIVHLALKKMGLNFCFSTSRRGR